MRTTLDAIEDKHIAEFMIQNIMSKLSKKYNARISLGITENIIHIVGEENIADYKVEIDLIL